MEIQAQEAFAFIDAFDDIQEAVHLTAVEKGWWEEPVREVGTAIALMHSELSEALEAYREDPEMGQPDHKVPDHPAVATELADTIIRIMDFAAYHKLDVSGALVAKANFNDLRPHKHGGKAC